MNLAIPLLIMLAVLLSAWGLGAMARGRTSAVRAVLAAGGIALLLVLPVAYESTIFDGNCYAADGTATPCQMSERLWQSFASGLAYMVPPVIFWLAMFFLSAKAPR